MRYQDEGKSVVSSWIGRQDWGKGIITWAFSDFLAHHNPTYLIYARVAKDYIGSRWVLEKSGFSLECDFIDYANLCCKDIKLLRLKRSAP